MEGVGVVVGDWVEWWSGIGWSGGRGWGGVVVGDGKWSGGRRWGGVMVGDVVSVGRGASVRQYMVVVMGRSQSRRG